MKLKKLAAGIIAATMAVTSVCAFSAGAYLTKVEPVTLNTNDSVEWDSGIFPEFIETITIKGIIGVAEYEEDSYMLEDESGGIIYYSTNFGEDEYDFYLFDDGVEIGYDNYSDYRFPITINIDLNDRLSKKGYLKLNWLNSGSLDIQDVLINGESYMGREKPGKPLANSGDTFNIINDLDTDWSAYELRTKYFTLTETGIAEFEISKYTKGSINFLLWSVIGEQYADIVGNMDTITLTIDGKEYAKADFEYTHHVSEMDPSEVSDTYDLETSAINVEIIDGGHIILKTADNNEHTVKITYKGLEKGEYNVVCGEFDENSLNAEAALKITFTSGSAAAAAPAETTAAPAETAAPETTAAPAAVETTAAETTAAPATTAAATAGDVSAAAATNKGSSPDTGIGDVAAVAGIAVLAAGAVVVAKKRK